MPIFQVNYCAYHISDCGDNIIDSSRKTIHSSCCAVYSGHPTDIICNSSNMPDSRLLSSRTLCLQRCLLPTQPILLLERPFDTIRLLRYSSHIQRRNSHHFLSCRSPENNNSRTSTEDNNSRTSTEDNNSRTSTEDNNFCCSPEDNNSRRTEDDNLCRSPEDNNSCTSSEDNVSCIPEDNFSSPNYICRKADHNSSSGTENHVYNRSTGHTHHIRGS